MPNIEVLLVNISDTISKLNGEVVRFCSITFKKAYSQLDLDPEFSKHCYIKITRGDCTSTYRFTIGFYCLVDMPAKFQKAMDCTLSSFRNKYWFLDDSTIVTPGFKNRTHWWMFKCASNFWMIRIFQLTYQNVKMSFRKAGDKLVWISYITDRQ